MVVAEVAALADEAADRVVLGAVAGGRSVDRVAAAEPGVLPLEATLDEPGENPFGFSGELVAVPLPLRAAQALSELPARLSTRLLFPSPHGVLFDACRWRGREFAWAREAAGLPTDVTPYTLRHSGISWALHAGIPASDVARFAGTSVSMLETRYHHLLSTSVEVARARLDAFTAGASDRLGQESATD